MTQQDVSAATAGDAPPRPRYRGRHLPMVAVVIAAFIATALAYSGMVLFGLEVANMEPLEAYALAGFLEVSLVAVALMARNAALEGRPYGVLLTLTWILSGTSGVFAALHEVAVPTASTPYMVVFRFVPPLVAALMWHLALVGERHLVTGHTLDERRREHRVHQYVTALELWRDARLDNSGNRRGTQKVRTAHERQRAARDRALKLLTVEDFERRMQVWVERLEAAERHGNRLDAIGADSVKRGTVRGAPGTSDDAGPFRSVESVAPASPSAPTGVLGERLYEPSMEFESLPAFEARVKEAFGTPPSDAVREPVTPTGPAASAGPAAPWPEPSTRDAAAADTAPVDPSGPAADEAAPTEPLPETGHTRRVEVFDLAGRAEAAPAVAQTAPWTPTAAEPVAEEPTEGDEARDEAPAAESDSARGDATEEPTSERDRRIVALAREGRPQREIADEVSASRSTVSRVVRRYEDQRPRVSDDDLELATV